MRLACVKRAASVDSEPGSNSRLNRLFNRSTFYGRPSLQFELKLLTKFLLRIQPDCQTSAHATHDFAKVDYNAGLESRSAALKTPLDQKTARYGSV